MEYLSVAQARSTEGIRLALSAHVPGPWGEAVKQMLQLKQLDFVPVEQVPNAENAELRAWTGCRTAPVLVTPDEEPLHSWRDIVTWIDGHRPEPPLLPLDVGERATALCLVSEIAGEGGFGWSRRMLTVDALGGLDGTTKLASKSIWSEIVQSYRLSETALMPAKRRIVEVLELLAGRLHDQRSRGSRFLVGHALSAADIYWACFSLQVDPDVPSVTPMSDVIRDVYRLTDPELLAALDPVLIEHRDFVLTHHLTLPLDF